jgi:hypothetical protein
VESQSQIRLSINVEEPCVPIEPHARGLGRLTAAGAAGLLSWVAHALAESMQLRAEGKIDALAGHLHPGAVAPHGLPLKAYKCAWFDEGDYFEFFPLSIVYAKFAKNDGRSLSQGYGNKHDGDEHHRH